MELIDKDSEKPWSMTIREAALILGRLVAWDHREYQEGDLPNPTCLVCQAIRVVKQNPPAVHVRAVRVEPAKED